MLDGLLSKAAGALFVGVPVGKVVMAGGSTLVVFRRLPKAVREFYRMLWANEKIGPNLKTAISAAAPTVAVAIPPVVTVGSAFFGAGYGFYRGFMKLSEVAGACKGKVNDLDKWIGKEVVRELEELRPKLAPGEKPFDVRLLEAAKGLLAGHLAAPVEAAGATVILLKHWPKLYRSVRRAIKHGGQRVADGDSPLRFLAKLGSAAAMDGFTVLAVAAVPVTPVVAYEAGFIDSFVEGYRHGLRATAKHVRNRFADFDKLLAEAEEKL